jgi:hypothetical protein
MRDGPQVVHLKCDGRCPDVRVGDYVTAEGVKENEQLFEADSVVVTRSGQPAR